MLSRPNRSAIVSLSSIAGQRPLLYLSPYSATKAFNDFFSRALNLEFNNKIDFISLRPGYVVSNMSKIYQKGGFVIDRYECARGCI
jgi:short-subunit dehydrogenase